MNIWRVFKTVIKGLGIDIARVDRFDERMVKRFLTLKEKEEYDSMTSEKRRREYIAGRWAIKEAFVKALGKGFGAISPKDIEVLHDKNGAPVVSFRGESLNDKCMVSLSHDGDYAVAVVVLLSNIEIPVNSR